MGSMMHMEKGCAQGSTQQSAEPVNARAWYTSLRPHRSTRNLHRHAPPDDSHERARKRARSDTSASASLLARPLVARSTPAATPKEYEPGLFC